MIFWITISLDELKYFMLSELLSFFWYSLINIVNNHAGTILLLLNP